MHLGGKDINFCFGGRGILILCKIYTPVFMSMLEFQFSKTPFDEKNNILFRLGDAAEELIEVCLAQGKVVEALNLGTFKN